MKKSELKSLIKEVIQEIVSGEDPNNPLYVEYVKDRPGEEPFMMDGQKFQFVTAKYPTGKQDVGVYAFSGDVTYGYQAFRQMYNLKEAYQAGLSNKGLPSVVGIIDNNVFPHTSDEIEKMAEKYNINVTLVGDAQFGTETMASYRIVFSGQQAQLKSLVDDLAKENGIEFFNPSNLKEAYQAGLSRKGLPSMAAIIDNNVFPYTSDEIEKMAEKHHIHVNFVGDAQFGTETMASYRLVLSGQQGELDSFVHNLAEENGIEFFDPKDSHKLQENNTESKWKKFTSENKLMEATKISAGNKDLEGVFHMAISTAEDNGQRRFNRLAEGAYSSEKYIVEVDLNKGAYKITNL